MERRWRQWTADDRGEAAGPVQTVRIEAEQNGTPASRNCSAKHLAAASDNPTTVSRFFRQRRPRP